MKSIIALLFVLLVSLYGFGQAQESSVEYQKNLRPAAVIELPYPPSVVNAAMNDYLSKKGRSKASDIKGFTTYRNTQPVPGDSSNADLYFKTERKSRREKEITMVSLLVMPPDTLSTSNLHYLSMEDAKDYLNGLSTAIEAYNLELTINNQNDAVLKAEAKYKRMTAEADDLAKKRADIDKKIEANKNDQVHQLQDIENQKQKLAQWVGQRKA